MADEQNPYAAVLADLERERDQLNAMIAMVKRRMGLSADEPILPGSVIGINGSAPESAEIRSDSFFGMSISEAIKKYLSIAKRPKRTSEIARALEDGGLQHTSKNWIGTVQTTLGRMTSTIVRVPNGWGLLEWYPGRNFEKQQAAAPKRRKKRKAKRARQSAESAPPNASRQLQGRYLGLLRKFPEAKRAMYKALAKEQGREHAVKAMERDSKSE